MSKQKENQSQTLFDVNKVGTVVPAKARKAYKDNGRKPVLMETWNENTNDLGLNGCYKKFGETIKNRGNITPGFSYKDVNKTQ
jgi:hypothetical protein